MIKELIKKKQKNGNQTGIRLHLTLRLSPFPKLSQAQRKRFLNSHTSLSITYLFQSNIYRISPNAKHKTRTMSQRK
jgi:hypothetical protein